MEKTFREEIEELAKLKAERKTIDDAIKKLTDKILDDGELEERHGGKYDLDGIEVKITAGATYKFIGSEDEFEALYPENCSKKFITKDLPDEDKKKFFQKKPSKQSIKFEGL